MESLTSNDIKNAFNKGKKIGEGAYGEVKLVKYNNDYYILKKFNNALAKKTEEDTHIQVFQRFENEYKGKDHPVCKPYKSQHPCISIQKPAHKIKKGEKSITLDEFFERIHDEILHTNTNATREKVKRNHITNLIGSKLVDILLQFEKLGILHGDFHMKNIMLVYRDNIFRQRMLNKITDSFSLKVIDFGHTQLTTVQNDGKILRLVPLQNPNNMSRIEELHNRIFRKVSNAKQRGIASNAHMYNAFPFDNKKRPQIIYWLRYKVGFNEIFSKALANRKESHSPYNNAYNVQVNTNLSKSNSRQSSLRRDSVRPNISLRTSPIVNSKGTLNRSRNRSSSKITSTPRSNYKSKSKVPKSKVPQTIYVL